MFKAKLYKQVAKYYDKLDARGQRRVNKAIEEIVKKPFGGPHIKKLKGRLEGTYRCDIGGIRIIYYIDGEGKIIYVEAMEPRGDVYK
ncbi:MAG: type II toxin-antitoxin system RelE/ParE family toxin [Acidobacteriota bacterium]|nr:type II toxin-antitoxin system RelE/ParE family toxin [Acidobacteriota bacterium]